MGINMNFINNWSAPVQLAAGVTALELDLPDGAFLLTLTDSRTEPTRWEIVEAQVQGGAAALVRGREGTLDQDWPAGSVIYLDVTAGWLSSVEQRLAAVGVTVSDNLPGEADVPAAVGATWVVPGQASLVALGNEFGSDWAHVAGGYSSMVFSYPVATPGASFDAEYSFRQFIIGLSGEYEGIYPALVALPWIGVPHGLQFTIDPTGADAISLTLVCSAMGETAYAEIENMGVAGAELAVAGSTITITVAQRCRLVMVSAWREAPEFGFLFRLEPVAEMIYLEAP